MPGLASALVLVVLLLWNVAPLAMVGWGLYAVGKQRPWEAGIRRDIGAGLIVSAIGTGGFILFTFVAVFSSGDAQAALGFLFMPILTWPVAVLTFGVGWAVSVLTDFFRSRLRMTETPCRIGRGRLIGAVCVVTMSLVVVGLLARHLWPYHQAESAATAADELRTLFVRASREGDHNMLMRLAQNPSAPPEVPRALSASQHLSVISRAVRNPDLPLDRFQELSGHDNAHVRGSLVWNPSIPRDVLEQLASDSDEVVRRGATSRLNGAIPHAPRKLGTLNNLLDLLFD